MATLSGDSSPAPGGPRRSSATPSARRAGWKPTPPRLVATYGGEAIT